MKKDNQMLTNFSSHDIRKALIAFIIMLFIFSCKKSSNSGGTGETNDDLSADQLQVLEQAGVDTATSFLDATFDDGRSMSDWAAFNDAGYKYVLGGRPHPSDDKLSLFIKSMTQIGDSLCKKGNWHFPDQDCGIAYVKGSRSISAPSIWKGAKCNTALYGLDCSGFIYLMTHAIGLDRFPIGFTETYTKVDTWNKAFDNSDFDGLQMVDLEDLPPAKIIQGDIIVSPNEHMGFVTKEKSTGKLEVMNSLGSGTYSCDRNSDKNHGPVRTRNLADWLTTVFTNKYHV